MKKLLLIMLMVFVSTVMLSSCDETQESKWKDKASSMIAGGMSGPIATALDCSNQAAIKATLKAKIQKLSWFKPQDKRLKGFVASSICKLAVNAVLPELIGTSLDNVPSEWKCSGESATKTIIELAEMGCAAIPL